MVFAITKRKKSSETKVVKWRTAFLTIPVGKVHFDDIKLRTLAQGTVGIQILVNRQNGDQKAGPFHRAFSSQILLNLAKLDMGHSNENVL